MADEGWDRVLVWNSWPTADGVPADLALGQVDRETCVNPGVVTAACGASTEGTPKLFPGFEINATKSARVEANGVIDRHATANVALRAT